MSTQTSNKLPILDNEGQNRFLGTLCAKRDGKTIALPLAGVDIKAKVVARVASVITKQKFTNPYSDFVEAVYIFPLSGGVAVDKFEMRVADRVIIGVIDERQAARQQYSEAIAAGKRAALLEQERDDVFTIQVGNLPPGEQVEITIGYSERLPYFDSGKTELRLPLVIGHRYIPGAALDREPVGYGTQEDTDSVSDASRITPPRLLDGVKSGVALSVSAQIATDESGISDLSSSQHATSTGMQQGWINVELSRTDEMLNRDFVLSWRMAKQEISSQFHLRKSDKNKDHYGMLTIVPPINEGFKGLARDVLFIVDRSGSMNGIKMTSAVRACSILLESLTPKDRFSVIAFDNVIEWMNNQKGQFVHADEKGLEDGQKFLRSITARGGTELFGAVQSGLQAIKSITDKKGRAQVLVVLTDGQIGDESRVLKELQANLGDARLFTVGIDTAVNSGLLKRLSSIGGGTCAFVQPGSQLEMALIGIAREIGTPLVTDIRVECESDGGVQKLTPDPVPDLFTGRAVSVFFRIPHGVDVQKIKVSGRLPNGKEFKDSASVATVEIDAIPQLWAKSYVTMLEDQFRCGQHAVRADIVAIAKEHCLLTKFTAFVVVDEAEIVNKTGNTRIVVQPVEEPAGWEMQQLQMAPSAHRLGSAPAASYCAPPDVMFDVPDDVEITRAQVKSLRKNVAQSFNQPLMKQQPAVNEPGAQNPWSSAPAAGGGGTAQPPALPAAPMPQQRWDAAESVKRKLPKSSTKGFWQSLFGKAEPSNDALMQALARLRNAFDAVCSAIDKGETVDGTQLDGARTEVLDALSKYPNASELPTLQRFMRVELRELIAAIASTQSTPEDLRRLARAAREALDKVRDELNDPATEGNFWEQSV